MKNIFLLPAVLCCMVFSGCSGIHDSRENLAAAAAEAIVEGEADDLWETLSPELQKSLIEKFGKDEDDTCDAMLGALRKKAAEKYQISDWDKAEDDEKLRRKIADDLLFGNKTVEINGKWFFEVR